MSANPNTDNSERELAVHRQDCPTFRRFWNLYALPPMRVPSCLVCGCPTAEPAIRHAELLTIVVCERCRDAGQQAKRQDDERAARQERGQS